MQTDQVDFEGLKIFLNTLLTGAVCDREKKGGGGSSSLSTVQCLAL